MHEAVAYGGVALICHKYKLWIEERERMPRTAGRNDLLPAFGVHALHLAQLVIRASGVSGVDRGYRVHRRVAERAVVTQVQEGRSAG